tara:strand:+ start:453 stop:887 length:435 start_codon:yes stop_codon:yes gene_type:complete
MGYNVVLEGKPKSRRPHFRTFTSFRSQADFVAELAVVLETDNIVAVGVTSEEAQELCQQDRDLVTMYYANIGEAYDWETGKFNRFIFDERSSDYAFIYGPCPEAILFIADSLESGRMKQPPPLHLVYNMSTIMPKSVGGILEDA